ncbi:RCC1/BLIP-II [Clavulina sp. PMI_390]|nr:RCC1/BLIP-II [Clavulina sp. PMI_390]
MTHLYAAGSNAKGQLGTGDDEDKSVFTPCLFIDAVSGGSPRSIACGSNHSLVLMEPPPHQQPETFNPVLLCAGDSSKGQLTFKNPNLGFQKLVSIAEKKSVVHVAACWETTYIVYRSDRKGKSDTCYAMGSNDFGALGGTPNPSSQFTDVSFAAALQSSAIIPISHKHSFRINDIVTGLHHIICHLHVTDGQGPARSVLVGWGASRHGQLSLQEYNPSQFSTSDAASSSSIAAPLPRNPNAQLRKSNGTHSFMQTPIHILTVPSDEQVLSIALGQQHSVVLFQHKDGTSRLLYGGSNRKGQLNFSLDIPINLLRSIHCTWNGTYLVEALPEGGFQIWATGSGEKGQLGRSHSTQPATSTRAVADDGGSSCQPVQFPFSTASKTLHSLSCGSEHVVAVLSDSESPSNVTSQREAWGWGWNEHGNLGLVHTEDVPLPTKIWPTPDPLSSVTNGNGHPARPVEETDRSVLLMARLRDAWAGNGTTWLALDSAGD